MEAREAVTGFSGTILVMKAKDTIFKRAYGFSNREAKIPNRIDSRFCLGSVTKQFTAACILQLQEQNKLRVDDPLSKYFPDFPQGEKVTLYMLLEHTSGLPDYLDQCKWTFSPSNQSQKEVLSVIKKLSYQFSPGSGFRYSNAGYFLLGCIIEKVSGETYSDYLQKHVFKAAKMTNSGLLKSGVKLPGMTDDFLQDGDTFKESSIDGYFDLLFSAGAIYSTVEDLYKWDRALNGNEVLSKASRKKMFTPNEYHFGYGVIADTLTKHFAIHFDGAYNWYKAELDRFTNDDICVAILSNNNESMPVLSSVISAILFDKEIEMPYIHKEVNIDAAISDNFLGRYRFVDKGDTIRIVKKEGKLFRIFKNTNDIELKPESETKLFYSDSDKQLEFFTDEKGRLSVQFVRNGVIEEVVKID